MPEPFIITPWEEIESSVVIAHSELILSSYEKLLGEGLAEIYTPQELYEANFVVLSHDGKADPCFTYANKMAQKLWQIDWFSF